MDKAEIGQVLRQLVTADGPTGVEGRVRNVVKELCAPYATEIRVDAMGSVIAYRAGTANGDQRSSEAASGRPLRIMLAAHQDEIGLIVTKVEGGFLQVARVGGVEARNIVGQEVTLYPTGAGADRYPDGLAGYVGARPPHVLTDEERRKVIPWEDLYIDLGFDGEGLVRVGDRAAVYGPWTELMGGRVATKALDNRASVAVMIGALGYLAATKHTWDVYAVATVQEEIGLKGAATSAYGIEPDIAIALDVTFADTPGVSETQTVAMDSGPAIAWGPTMHPGIVKRLRATAEALEIDYVTDPDPSGMGTDAFAIQAARAGIPTSLLSVPVRYMHSAVETLAVADVDRAARLLAAFISGLDAAFLASLPEEV